ncbi:hypothetical protein EV421DRAFT_1786332 [Armillaria borealis]|uniref:Uncharacterized protein n=1 Tax=Armillaria borealis TaxID=47425 RepID=A0AA39JSP7_9AGAR|nr:hypothetical protein EV421DRAFT_1786332 [Armillaria borealis]
MIGVIIIIVFVLCCIKKIHSFMLVAPTRPGLLVPSTPTSALPLIAEPIWPPDSKADKATSFGAKGRIHHGSHEPKRASWITPPPPYHPDAAHEYSWNSGLPSSSATDRMSVDVCS